MQLEFFLFRGQVLGKIADEPGPYSVGQREQNLISIYDRAFAYGDDIARRDIAGRLGVVSPDLYAAALASLRSLAARFENTYGPQKFVNPYRVHCLRIMLPEGERLPQKV